MKINKKWKIAITTLCSAALLASSLTILFWNVDARTPISSYVLQFQTNQQSSSNTSENPVSIITPEQAESNKVKNKLINDLRSETKKVISEYKKTNPNASLDFYFANLTRSQTPGEKNYFTYLDRTLKDIDPILGINNLQRNPKLVNEAYYNKNTELMSFYWSPDYNAIGTWLKYMITDTYTLPNMWPPTYAILEHHRNDPRYPWAQSLYDFIQLFKIPGSNDPLYMSPTDLLGWIVSDHNVKNLKVDDYYVNIANVIGAWVKENSMTDIEFDQHNNPTRIGKLPYGVQYVNWISSMNPNIPYQEMGAGTKSPMLVREGFYAPTNPNGDTTFRDWYINDNFNKTTVNDWVSADPFSQNETAWNGPFSRAANSLFAQSIWTGLTSWATIGDENDPNFPEEQVALVSNGIYDDITNKDVRANLEKEFKTSQTMTFKIRPIPWVNSNGEKTGSYLSPQDFAAGFKAFGLSVKNGMNKNNAYFISLAAVDFEKTLKEQSNWKRNLSPTDHFEFKVHFSHPILTFSDVLDIFQKQYFMALPAENELVKNIIDDQRYSNIAKSLPGNPDLIDLSKTDITKFYGLGDGRNESVWSQLWSCAPYYISFVNNQKIIYKINNEYFKSFDNVKDVDGYQSFNLTKKIGNYTVKKIDTVDYKYAGAYNPDILYEQFKSGEIDKTATLQAASLEDAIKNQSKYLRYISTKKINRSNTIGFNLQIYERWNESPDPNDKNKRLAQNIIIDSTGKPMWDPVKRQPTYTIDEYGNYKWPAGKKPKIKSNVSQAYADLIASDFYTPHENGGKSQLIRFTILNTINWVSLKSLVSPGVTASIQYSFMPYGVYSIDDSDSRTKANYWTLAATKIYMTDQQLLTFNLDSIKQRMSGNMIWTYAELMSAIIK